MTYNDKAAISLINFFSVNCAAVAHPSGVSQRRDNTPCGRAAPITSFGGGAESRSVVKLHWSGKCRSEPLRTGFFAEGGYDYPSRRSGDLPAESTTFIPSLGLCLPVEPGGNSPLGSCVEGGFFQ